MEGSDRGRTGFGEQLAAAPAVCRFICGDLVAARLQLSGDAAEEVGVAVVPVGNQRMAEDDGAHVSIPARAVRGSVESWLRSIIASR